MRLSLNLYIGGAAVAGLVAVAGLASCSGRSDDSADGPRVVATTTQIADWVRAVGGDEVDLDQVLQPNTDPHEYEPRPDDVVATADADVVFTNGDDLDAWSASLTSESGSDAEVVDLGVAAPIEIEGEGNGVDPHWWHDPRNAIAAVAAIADRLAQVDPADAKRFADNAAAYEAKLRRLDRGIRACIDGVPKAERLLVTDHDAFGYFTERYGIEVVGAAIPSQTTAAQASAGEVSDLIDLIEERGVRAIFPESSLNPDLAETIADETGASADYTLYGDSLGPPDSPAATYIDMERANADAMVRGFTGGSRGCG